MDTGFFSPPRRLFELIFCPFTQVDRHFATCAMRIPDDSRGRVGSELDKGVSRLGPTNYSTKAILSVGWETDKESVQVKAPAAQGRGSGAAGVAPRLPEPLCHDSLLLHSSLRLSSSGHPSLRHHSLSCICPSSRPSNLAGCRVSIRLLALTLVEPFSFGWLSRCLPSARTFASHRATASSVAAPPSVSRHLRHSSICRLLSRIRLLLRLSHG
jgi:hypothetical protein